MHQALDQRRQAEASVDAVLCLSQIALAVLGEAEMMVRPMDGCLDVGDSLLFHAAGRFDEYQCTSPTVK